MKVWFNCLDVGCFLVLINFVLLYHMTGRMLLLATGSLLVMVDLDTEGRPQPKNGLFRAFRSASSLGQQPSLTYPHYCFTVSLTSSLCRVPQAPQWP